MIKMPEKIYITEDNTATFICPNCHKVSVKDATRYLEKNKPIRLKVKCCCGHTYAVFLEKRRKIRKTADLSGAYTFSSFPADPEKQAGSLRVKNLSYSGLRVQLQAPPLFHVGDTLFIEFHLDDANQSRIRKKVIVKNIQDLSVGLAYADPQTCDSALGFYLFN